MTPDQSKHAEVSIGNRYSGREDLTFQSLSGPKFIGPVALKQNFDLTLPSGQSLSICSLPFTQNERHLDIAHSLGDVEVSGIIQAKVSGDRLTEIELRIPDPNRIAIFGQISESRDIKSSLLHLINLAQEFLVADSKFARIIVPEQFKIHKAAALIEALKQLKVDIPSLSEQQRFDTDLIGDLTLDSIRAIATKVVNLNAACSTFKSASLDIPVLRSRLSNQWIGTHVHPLLRRDRSDDKHADEIKILNSQIEFELKPSLEDLNALRTFAYSMHIGSSSKVIRVQKIVHPGGVAYLVLEKGSNKVTVVGSTQSNREFQYTIDLSGKLLA